MESFLVLLSVISFGTISPLQKVENNVSPAVEARSIQLSKTYSDQVKKELDSAPDKIISLCTKDIKLTYEDSSSDTLHYKCGGEEVMFFNSGDQFYASISSTATEEGFVVIENERLSRSLNRQVRKIFRDSNEVAKLNPSGNHL